MTGYPIYDVCITAIIIAVTCVIVVICASAVWRIILTAIVGEYRDYNDRQAFEAYLELSSERRKLLEERQTKEELLKQYREAKE